MVFSLTCTHCVTSQVLELDNGELAMITAGEVHLQKCLKDLEDLGFSDLEAS